MTLDEATKALQSHFGKQYKLVYISYHKDAWLVNRIASRSNESSCDYYPTWTDLEAYIKGLKHRGKT